MGKIVRYELDLDNPPPLTERQKAELEALAKMSDVAWFKRRAGGQRGYQTDINKALREYVTRQQKKAG